MIDGFPISMLSLTPPFSFKLRDTFMDGDVQPLAQLRDRLQIGRE